MKTRSFFFLALCTLTLAGCAKTVVVKVGNSPVASEGVIYALPNTVVRIAAKIDKVEKKGAPFSEYAAIFAPDGKPVCKKPDCSGEDAVSFAVQQGAAFSTYGEPDPEHVYLVKFSNGKTIDQTLSMTWNEAGLLSAASASVTNRTIDIVVSGLKLAAGLGTKAAGLGGPGIVAATKCSDIVPGAADVANDAKFVPALPPEVRETYCAMSANDRTSLSFNATLVQRASDAFKMRLLPLLKARENALAGQSPSMMEPAAILPRIDTEIASREAALYLGTKGTTTWEATFDVRNLSENADIGMFTIAKDGVCPGAGVVPPDGKVMPAEFASASGCTGGTAVNLKLNYYPASDRQLFGRIQPDNEESHEERSFRYRIPAQVKGVLSQGPKQLGAGIFAVAQFGRIVSLPAKRTSKTISYDLAFVEATGALKTFKLGTAGGLDSSTIDALAGVAGTALDAKNKASDPVVALTREDQLLKLKDDICTIQKKYNLPCTVQP